MMENSLVENSAKLGEICAELLGAMKKKYPDIIGNLQGKGLAWGLIFVKKGTKDIDPDLAHDIVRLSIEKGLLFFAPVGAGATIKVTPPLMITEEALREGLDVLAEAGAEAVEG